MLGHCCVSAQLLSGGDQRAAPLRAAYDPALAF
jgi:hypothetical protein